MLIKSSLAGLLATEKSVQPKVKSRDFSSLSVSGAWGIEHVYTSQPQSGVRLRALGVCPTSWWRARQSPCGCAGF